MDIWRDTSCESLPQQNNSLVIGCILFWPFVGLFFHNTAEASPRNSYVSIFISASPCQPYRAIWSSTDKNLVSFTVSASPRKNDHDITNNKNKNNAPPFKESLRIKHVLATPCTLLCVGYSISTLPSGSRARQYSGWRSVPRFRSGNARCCFE